MNYQDYDIFITLIRYKYGYNLRLRKNVRENFNYDGGEFEKDYATISDTIKTILKKKHKTNSHTNFLKELSNKESVNYLFHQHIWQETTQIDKECQKEITWSIYKHKTPSIEMIDDWLNVDTYILQRHVMYYSSSYAYVDLIENNVLDVKKIREKLNHDRSMIAQHELELHDFASKYINMIQAPLGEKEKNTLYDLHHVPPTKNTYEKLDNDLLHYAEEIERERQYKTSLATEVIVFVVTVLSVVSIVSSFISLMTSKPFYHDINSSAEIGLMEAWEANHLNTTLFGIVSLLIIAIIIIYLFTRYWHKIPSKKKLDQ